MTTVDEPGATLSTLSEGQQAIWIDVARAASGSGDPVPLALRIRGELNLARLRDAFAQVCDRAPILRSVVAEVDGVPQLRRDPAAPSVGHEPGRERSLDEIAADLAARAQAPIVLARGPLVAVHAVSRAADDHVVLVVSHPIVLDEHGGPAFLEAWWRAYDALAPGPKVEGGGFTPTPGPAAPGYAELVRWEDGVLAGPAAADHQAYWRRRLEGAAVVELPSDRPRAPQPDIDRQVHRRTISAEHTARIADASQALGVDPAAFLLGVFHALLHRYTGETDLTVGMPVAGAPDPRFAATIGPRANTLVVRTALDPARPFADHARAVGATLAEDLTHAGYPFARVVRDLGASRRQAAMFHLGYAYDDGRSFARPELTALAGGALRVARLAAIASDAMFGRCELGLEARRIDGAYRLSLVYDGQLFDRATVERMLDHYARLLASALDAPELPVARQAMLSPEEANPALLPWNRTDEPLGAERCVPALFADQVARTPDAVAISHNGRSLSYAELDRRTNQIAHHLRAHGIGPDGVVAIYLHRGIDMIASVLAILKAGGAYLPVDPSYPAERIEYMLSDAAPGVVLTQAALRDRLPAGASRRIALDAEAEAAELALRPTHAVEDLGLAPHHLAFVIYTSGSTGQPKGVAMHHASLVNLIEWHRRGHSGAGPQRTLQFAALGFDVAFQELFATLAVGGTLVLLDEDIRRDPQALCGFLRDHAIQRMFMPFGALQSIADAMDTMPGELPSLEDVVTGGEQLRTSPAIVRLFRRTGASCALYNHYGPTETHVITCEKLPARPEDWPELPSIGRPIANTRIYILDGQQQPVPIGVPGEIYIAGVAVARGYLTRADLTRERFLPDPFRPGDGARMYRTGDVARFRADGRIEFLGRNDHQVKIRGFRVELGEIEAQLSHHPGVREVAVIARPDAVGTKQLIAYITPAGEPPGAAALRGHLQSRVPDFMIPSAFVVSDSLPRSPNGKLDRRALPAPDDAARAARVYEAPRGEREVVLARIWGELMGLARVGRNDDFFELGGHSLMVMQVIVRIRERLALELPPRALFVHRTLVGLAEYVASVDELKQLARRGDPAGGTSPDKAKRTRGSL